MDVVWYWSRGTWFGVFDLLGTDAAQVAQELRRGGFVAHGGRQSIGAPEGPPSAADFRSLPSPPGY